MTTSRPFTVTRASCGEERTSSSLYVPASRSFAISVARWSVRLIVFNISSDLLGKDLPGDAAARERAVQDRERAVERRAVRRDDLDAEGGTVDDLGRAGRSLHDDPLGGRLHGVKDVV